MSNHRIDQLINRINKADHLATEVYYDRLTGNMCIIGHMADMAGVLDEGVTSEKWVDTGNFEGHFIPHRISFKDFGGFIDKRPASRIMNTICEHFGVGETLLRELQDANDGDGKQAVLDILETIDVEGCPL